MLVACHHPGREVHGRPRPHGRDPSRRRCDEDEDEVGEPPLKAAPYTERVTAHSRGFKKQKIPTRFMI